jgi:DNA-directed RNA polymerase subunit RPC12/RpoP
VNFFKKYQCDKCNKKIVHGKDSQYDCKECDKDFSNMEDMRTHLQRKHSYKKDR